MVKKNAVLAVFLILLQFQEGIAQQKYSFARKTIPDSLYEFNWMKYVKNDISSFVIGMSNLKNHKLTLVEYSNDSITPIWFEYIAFDSIIIAEGSLIEGEFNGIITQYDLFENRRTKSLQITYKNNIAHGPAISYLTSRYLNEGDYIYKIVFFADGVMEGPEITYNSDGSFHSIFTLENGKVTDNKYKVCYETGYAILKYRNNDIVKTWNFNLDGSLFRVMNRRKGERDPRWHHRVFNPNIFFRKDCMGR